MNVSVNHPVDREDVMAWLDGELPDERARDVSAHLERCAECGALADDFRRMSMRLAAWAVEAAPVAIGTALTNVPRPRDPAARTAPATSRVLAFRRWTSGWGLAAAASLALVVLVFTRLTYRSAVPPPLDASQVESLGQPAVIGESLAVSGQGRQMTIALAPTGPMIVRTASLRLTTDQFDRARADIERIVAEQSGLMSSLEVTGTPPQPRVLQATLRIPSSRFDAAIAALRLVGRVQQESLDSSEVTDQYRDLTVRIANSKREEQRLVELLAKRTGDLADVLAVEQAIGRVRGEIERMEAEERAMKGRVDLATITIQLSENYRAEAGLGPTPVRTRFRNALIDGTRDALEGVTAAALAIVRIAPTLLVWTVVLAWPARRLWRTRSARR